MAVSKSKDKNFYDRIGKRYGEYGTAGGVVIKKEFSGENPEETFKKVLLNLKDPDKRVLDLGCGDGRFTLLIAPYFKEVLALDTSSVLLAFAKKLQKNETIPNVVFSLSDAGRTNYEDAFFDVVYSRRGPVPLQEIGRVLKSKGVFVGIEIAESDCRELKEIFGRGQNYNEWKGASRRRKDIQELKNLGFKIVFARDYFFKEYYNNREDFEDFLKRVPIFDDFDSRKDSARLANFIGKNTTKKGIRLARHKLVVAAEKK